MRTYKIYAPDCETWKMEELETINPTNMCHWIVNNGNSYHGLLMTSYPNLKYVEIIQDGRTIIQLPKDNIKEIYKLWAE